MIDKEIYRKYKRFLDEVYEATKEKESYLKWRDKKKPEEVDSIIRGLLLTPFILRCSLMELYGYTGIITRFRLINTDKLTDIEIKMTDIMKEYISKPVTDEVIEEILDLDYIKAADTKIVEDKDSIIKMSELIKKHQYIDPSKEYLHDVYKCNSKKNKKFYILNAIELDYSTEYISAINKIIKNDKMFEYKNEMEKLYNKYKDRYLVSNEVDEEYEYQKILKEFSNGMIEYEDTYNTCVSIDKNPTLTKTEIKYYIEVMNNYDNIKSEIINRNSNLYKKLENE